MKNTQDWEPVVFGGKKKKTIKGSVITTEKKFGGGKNAHFSSGISKKLAEDEIPVIKTVDISFGKRLQQARCAKKLSQKQLAQKLNEKLQVIQSYENGKANPNHTLISKMERVLGAKLRKKK